MTTRAARSIPLLFLVLSLGCDGGGGDADAGLRDAAGDPVVLTVHESLAASNVSGVGPRAGYQLYLLDITIEARMGTAVPIAPFAFELSLEDRSRVTADASFTNSLTEGCRSGNVPVGESRNCILVFEVVEGAAAPATLRWTDGSRSASATVPPLTMP